MVKQEGFSKLRTSFFSTITPHYDDAKTVYALVEKDQWYCVTTRRAEIMICHWHTIQQLKFRILRSITLANLKLSREMYGKGDSNDCFYF